MEQILTIDYPLISIHHEAEESTQNWMLRAADSNHVPPNINLRYGRTYTDISSQHLSTIQALMGCFLANYYHLKSMHHEEEESRSGC